MSARVLLVAGGSGREAELGAATCAEFVSYLDDIPDVADVSCASPDKILSDPAAVLGVCEVAVLIDSHTDALPWSQMARLRDQFDTFGVRVVGQSAATLVLCRDKYATRNRLLRDGIVVPVGGLLVDGPDQFPAVVKPRYGASSRGVELVQGQDELQAHHRSDQWIWEAYVEGAEITIGVVVGADGPRALAPLEVELVEGLIYDFETKMVTESNRLHVPARLDQQDWAQVSRCAAAVAESVEASFVIRVDLRVADGECFVIDVNAEPVLHSQDFVALSLEHEGATMRQIVVEAVAAVLTGS